METKSFYEKTEEFAKKIISLAKEDGLTVKELSMAADVVKRITDSTIADIERAKYSVSYKG